MKFYLFLAALFFCSSMETGILVELCSYASDDEKCESSLLCQDFRPGYCIRHEDCDETQLCYANVLFVNEEEILIQNFYSSPETDDSPECLYADFGFEPRS